MKSNLADLTVQLLHETDNAVLVKIGTWSEAVWLPKSQVEVEATGSDGLCEITLPQWLAEERGLV